MKKILVLIDLQNDFIDGALGSKAAQEIVPKVVDFMKNNLPDKLMYTMDTHEGEKSIETSLIPEHCVYGTLGWHMNDLIATEIIDATHNGVPVNNFTKTTFACPDLAKALYGEKDAEIYMMGLCTDICVISNALMLRAACPDLKIIVVENCCAGTSEANHKAALEVMKSNCIDVTSYM